MKITRTSMITGKTHTVDLDVTEEQLQAYEQGTLLQDAFPDLPAPEREFIKTGITPEEWRREVLGETEKSLTKEKLRNFTGSEHWYRHPINRKVTFTDGAKYVADAGGAYWLLDEIALIQPYDRAIAAARFQVWKLTVRPDHTATLTCEDGNCNEVYRKEIEFTDFPLDEITLWFANNVIYLPSEH